MAKGFFPATGVVPAQANNAFVPTQTPVSGCSALYYASNRCNQRIDTDALNGLMAVIAAAIDDAGLGYDCSDPHQLRLAIEAIIARSIISVGGGADILQGYDSATKKFWVRSLEAGTGITIDPVEYPVGSGKYKLKISASASSGGTSSGVWGLVVEDQRAAGVSSDAATTTWSRLALNTIVSNDLSASLSGNTVTGLAAGPYYAEWRSMGANCGRFRSRLVNATTNAVLGLSSSGYSNTTEESNNAVTGQVEFTLAAGQALALDSIAETATGQTETCNWGWHGLAAWGVVEVYTQLRLQKIA